MSSKFIQILNNITYILKAINATTLAEGIQTLDEITYSLWARGCHNISRHHSNTPQDHILAEGPWGTTTSVEFIVNTG
jgi:hypothetical protein